MVLELHIKHNDGHTEDTVAVCDQLSAAFLLLALYEDYNNKSCRFNPFLAERSHKQQWRAAEDCRYPLAKVLETSR